MSEALRLAQEAVALAERATPGPWVLAGGPPDAIHGRIGPAPPPDGTRRYGTCVQCLGSECIFHDDGLDACGNRSARMAAALCGQDDARLIAHAGTHYATVAQALLAAQARLDEAEEVIRGYAAQFPHKDYYVSACKEGEAFIAGPQATAGGEAER